MNSDPLPGTTAEWGVIEAITLTAYRRADGTFVPFTKVHPRTPATPLVRIG